MGCGMPVVPVRQFSEMPFADRDSANNLFAVFENSLPFNHSDAFTDQSIAARTYPKARVLRGMRLKEDGWAMRNNYYCWICSTYLKMSLLDEADMLFEKVYNGVRQDSVQVRNWIDGNSGARVNGTAVSTEDTVARLTRVGLLRARDTITGCGFGSEGIVCYTTIRALVGLEKDCTSSGAPESFQWLPGGSMALVDGILMVPNSSRALQIADHNENVARSVMFVDGVSFGTVSDDTVTVRAKRHPNNMMQFSATHWTGGVIRNADSVCCILHG